MRLFYTKLKSLPLLTLFFTLAAMQNAYAQPSVAGDIAFTSIITQGTANDGFSFVSMQNIPPGFAITFTDNGYNRVTNTLNTTEGTIVWTAPASGFAKGTEVTIYVTAGPTVNVLVNGIVNTPATTGTASITAGSFSLASSGDNLVAYRPGSPNTYLGIISWSTTGTIAAWDNTANPVTSNQSGFPSTFTNGVNCLQVYLSLLPTAAYSNFRYTGCSVTSTAALATAVHNAANWTGNAATQAVTGWMPACNLTALSVDGLNLSARNKLNFVQLEWTAQNLRGNTSFTIERSYDGNRYTELAQLPGITGQNNYSLNDAEALRSGNAVIYYRIKAAGLDGSPKYSNVAIVKNEGRSLLVQDLPNPFTGTLGFTLVSPSKATAAIRLTDLSGKVIAARNLSLTEGDNRINLSEANNLATGVYLLNVEANGQRKTYKVVKQ